MTRSLILASIVLLLVANVGLAAPATDGNGVQATFENDPPAGDATVLYNDDTAEYVFLWGNKRTGEVVARTGTNPHNLSELRTVLDPKHVDGQPKFSGQYINGTYHLLVTGHQSTKVVYYRGDTLSNLSRVETVINAPEGDWDDLTTQQTYRSALLYHNGTWFFYLAQERFHFLDNPLRAKETVIYTGQNLTSLTDSGAAINYQASADLSILANVRSVWYNDDTGEFRAFIDGSGYYRGTHRYVFTATSDDGLHWTVPDEPELDVENIDTGYNSKHVYAPSGVWVNGTFVGLAVGSETHEGPNYDRYDHDTTLVITDQFRVSLDDFVDRVPDPAPPATPTPTRTPMPTSTATASPTETPGPATSTPTRMPTAAPEPTARPDQGGNGGGGGGDWYPTPPQTPTVTPMPTRTPEPTLEPVHVGQTPTAGASDVNVLRWLLRLLRGVQP